MSRNFAFGASAFICFSVSVMSGRTTVLKIPGMASARGLADVPGVPAADAGVGVAALERLVGAAAVADREQALSG
ncbi:hypothetical protein [Streptomyces sp. NPDC057381]|uniref:hypothetical protein n=1 Tax=Streptomyces sp. NPDC057381 TaxID=3346111 RepID=UPI00363708AF